MDQVIRALTIKELSTGLGFINGQMDRNITGIGTIMLLKESVFIPGLTEENIEENGKTQTCTESDPTNGQMAESSQASTTMTKSTATVSTHGPTTENTEAGGKKENKTALEFTSFTRKQMNKNSKENPHLPKSQSKEIQIVTETPDKQP